MFAEISLVILLPALLIAAAACDLASFTIPNPLNLAVCLLFAIFAFSAKMSVGGIAAHLLAGIVGLCIGFVLFARGWVGGGDAKLYAGMAFWLGLKDLPAYSLLVSLVGGGLTVALLFLRRHPLPAILLQLGWLVKLHDSKSGVPYGLAFAAGAFIILPSTEIFRLAAQLS